jgi:hypothetical protein
VSIDFASVRERVDLVELVTSRLGEGRRVGREHVFLCPHGERTPSLHVNREKGSFYCFGCGAKGDALDFLRLVDGLTLEEALVRLDAAPEQRPAPRRIAAPARPTKDAAALWQRLAEHDDAAEVYLAGRGLLYRDPDVLLFNVGGSGDPWLDTKAAAGYRVAFAVRRPDGAVQTISLRHVGPGEPPEGKKTLALLGCPTSGAAIVSPGVAQLAGGDSEFAADRVLVLEGGTSWLGAAALFAQASADYGSKAAWPLGAIGVRQAAGVVTAFASVVRWRTVLVGLDADEAGRTAAPEVEDAARKAGARDVIRTEAPGAKDWAELARSEYANA